eukprot:jgi/Picsp_1/1646/NSC_05120-R1_hypothetical protein CHLNCDRAFT_140035 [Chlorella variabilis]
MLNCSCRRVLKGFLCFASLLCILVGTTPYILSTRYGLGALCTVLNAISKVKVSIGNADVRWRTKHPFVEGFKLAYNKQELMTIDRAYATKSVWKQMTRNQNRDDRVRVFIRNPKISAQVDSQTGFFWWTKALTDCGLGLGPKPLCDGNCEGKMQPPVVPKAFQSDVVDESFSAEIVLDKMDIFVSDGVLKMPKAMRDVLGGRLFVDVSLYKHMSSRQLTVEKKTLSIHNKLQVEMDSPDFRFSLSGGMTPDGYLVVPIDNPIKFTTSITPAIIEAFLKTVNPFVTSVVDLQTTGLQATLTPKYNVWPSSAMTLELEEFELQVGQNKTINNVMKILSLGTGNKKLQQYFRDKANAIVKSGKTQVEMKLDQSMIIHPTNISLGVPGVEYPIELILSGTTYGDTSDPRISMTAAIAETTLENIFAIKGLTENDRIPIIITGTVSKPSIAFNRALTQIGLLLLDKRGSASFK